MHIIKAKSEAGNVFVVYDDCQLIVLHIYDNAIKITDF